MPFDWQKKRKRLKELGLWPRPEHSSTKKRREKKWKEFDEYVKKYRNAPNIYDENGVSVVYFDDGNMITRTRVELDFELDKYNEFDKLKQYIRAVKTDRYRCEALYQKSSEEEKALEWMKMWLEVAYKKLNRLRDESRRKEGVTG